MDLRRQLHIVRTRLWLILLVTIAFGGAGLLAATLAPRQYEARATILIGQSLSSVNPDYNQLLTSQRLTLTYASLATRRPILDAVISTLGLKTTADDLLPRIDAEPSQTTAFLTIVVRGRDAAETAAIANEVANQVIAASPTVSGQQVDFAKAIDEDLQATRTEIESASKEAARLQAITSPTPRDQADLFALQDRLASLRSTYASLLGFQSTTASNLLTLIEPAVAPTSPSAPSRFLLTILAGILGLLLATAILFAAEYLNDSLKRPEDVEEVLGLPTLGSIGRLRGDRSVNEVYRLVTLVNPRSPAAEAYRSIRANVDFTSVDRPIRTLLVASATASEGKTVTAGNLALVFAQAGRRVLLIDADLRRPGVHTIFRATNARGVTSLVLDPNLDPARVVQMTEQGHLTILTSGPLPPNPAEILGSHRFGAILEQLAADFDLIVIDTPPLQAVADAAILSARVDGTIIVVDAGKSRRESVVRARDTLVRAGAQILGVVLNRVARDVDGAAYITYAAAAPDEDRATSSKPG